MWADPGQTREWQGIEDARGALVRPDPPAPAEAALPSGEGAESTVEGRGRRAEELRLRAPAHGRLPGGPPVDRAGSGRGRRRGVHLRGPLRGGYLERGAREALPGRAPGRLRRTHRGDSRSSRHPEAPERDKPSGAGPDGTARPLQEAAGRDQGDRLLLRGARAAGERGRASYS